MDDQLAANATTGKYTVVARRYRPKTFAELVGQSTVSQALINAIQTNRVGHAYLFTGARGVGKTSTARIFAKALNAASEANGEFDPNSDIALAIDSGEDMDVIEIDGASNRGIDEIRQLRANAAIRPSRSKYKIYIIDEVHMLTTQAFNALLKTLEEPPAHVKFIFCTTDPEKMPITVLSRCQRFDFPPVQTDQILGRLKFICENEGRQADEAALQLVARRAAGSMRDSQSLLEQLLSFGGEHIRVDDVHAMLGTADETRLALFAAKMIERDAAAALKELDNAVNEGVDAGQLTEQLLGYLRDMMVVTVGCTHDLVKTANPSSIELLKEWGATWGVASLMAAIQILDDTIVKMRHSVQSRVLMEIALVQICQLQDLQALTDLVRAFASGKSVPPPRPTLAPPATSPAVASEDSKKKVEPVTQTDNASPSVSNSQPNLPPPVAPAASHEPAAVVAAEIAPQGIAQQGIAPQPSLVASYQALTPDGNSAIASSTASSAASHQASVNLIDSLDKKTSDVKTSVSKAPDTALPSERAKEQNAPTPPPMAPSSDSDQSISSELRAFRQAAEKMGGLIIECSNMVVRIQTGDRGVWKVMVAKEGSFAIDFFGSSDTARKLSHGISEIVGHPVNLEFIQSDESAPHIPAAERQAAIVEEERPAVPQSQLIRGAMNNPLVKHFVEMFEGQVVRVDRPMRPRPTLEPPTESSSADSA